MSAVANDRGEVAVTLDADYVMRPTFTASAAIEQQTGKSLIELCLAAERSTLSMHDAAIIVTEYIRAWAQATEQRSLAAVQAARVKELIYDAGAVVVMPRISIVLLAAITGGVKPGEAQGEDDAGEQKAAETEEVPAA